MDATRTSWSPVRVTGLVVGAAAAAALWRGLFIWWAQDGSYQLFKILNRALGIGGAGLVFATDCVFALLTAALFSWVFLRLVRSAAYVAEAIVVPAFVAALLGVAQWLGGDAIFFVQLPTLWLFVMIFAIVVGYGEKFRRLRRAAID